MNSSKSNERESGERTLPDSYNLYEFKRIYNWVNDNYSKEGLKVLDYGCGSGYGTYIMSNAFSHVRGVDVSADSIEVCRKQFVKEGLSYSVIEENDRLDSKYDLVLSSQVIEHVDPSKAAEFIRNIYSHLENDGIALITTPNANNYYNNYSGFEFHLKEYTLDELKTLVELSLPNIDFDIHVIEDVLTTKLKNKIRKFGRNSLPFKVLAKIISSLIAPFEKYFFSFKPSYLKIIKHNPNNIYGSHLIVIRKK